MTRKLALLLTTSLLSTCGATAATPPRNMLPTLYRAGVDGLLDKIRR